MEVRLDKWLHVARMFKTRSQATHACNLSRVKVNGAVAKAHRRLNLEDRVEVEKGEWTRILIVRELKDRPIAKAEVPNLFEDLSPPPPAADPMARLLRATPARRERGTGRPTKKDRRAIEKLEG
jgi:ribosome-associated heat shock protein Hsp15